MHKVLKIKATRNGYRRCGFGFSDTEAREIPLDKLTDAQVKILTNDPGLIVVEGGKDAPAPAEDKEAGALQAKLKASEEGKAAAEKRVAELEAALKTSEEGKAAAEKRVAELEAAAPPPSAGDGGAGKTGKK